MHRSAPLWLASALVVAPVGATERADVPTEYTWNLRDLYPDETAWMAARDELRKRIALLPSHRGHLGESSGALLRALEDRFGAKLALERLTVYADALSDQDVREQHPRELKLQAAQLGSDFRTATAWIAPELIAVGKTKVDRFVKREKRLAPYAFFLQSTLRFAPHTLTAAEERVHAQAGPVLDSGLEVYSTLFNADVPWPTVRLSTGEVRLDLSGYDRGRSSPVRDDRDRTFTAFYGALKAYQRTMGATLDAQLKAHVVDQKVHRYGSTLEAALFPRMVRTEVYSQLVADVRRNLPTFHRYLALRKRMLGVDVLRYQDLYAPMVAQVSLSYRPDEARAIVLEALAPLGDEYVSALKTGFQSRWTDYLPSTGKMGGAYSTGVWGAHPIQLLNFDGKYGGLTVLAHESGHSMHTHLSNAAQPYPTSSYPEFVMEVPSTVNEVLLVRHLLSRTKDDPTRLAILGNYLDRLRGTIFRQTQFAEFELAIHQAEERGEPVTGERLSEMYLKLVREYHGQPEGLMQVDDLVATEWEFIHHFYRNYYVYQYATSMVAATALARGILDDLAQGSTAARDRYLAMLKAGGSRDPIELLRSAGVDPTTSAPFDSAMAEMNRTMDEMEKLLASKASAQAR